jgi:F420-non-reducing hydrogenase small subunit
VPNKIQIAVNWAASCGGCDVSLLDIETHLLELASLADIVYWPVAMDFKADHFLALPDKSVDIGLFNGALRTSEHVEMARAFRAKCQVLVAYGSCACFGGIPGLANLASAQEIFEVAYQSTPSTENPEGARPETEWQVDGHTLTLPVFLDLVSSLPQAVDVDVQLPGCPPPTERVLDLVGLLRRYAETGQAPPEGTVLASDNALCDECPRNATRATRGMAKVVRPHEVLADPSRCFLDQGILCMGIATRGGCGLTCLEANQPCRGCFGPTAHAASQVDAGARAISAIGSLAGSANENDVPAHKMMRAVRSIKDPVGTFYRFSLPNAFLNRAVKDEPQQE